MGVIYDTQQEVLELLDGVNDRLYKKSYNDYIVLMARGDVIPELVNIGKEPYVVDYQMDHYYDETRERFYVEYLQKRYRKEGFDYTGEDGFFDLNIELMIYSHIWESHYLLKTLSHIADLLSGKPYNWGLRIPFNNNKNYIKENIIIPLIEAGDDLGTFLKDAYSPNLRNGFAHSMYDIDCKSRKISLHNLKFDKDDTVQHEITFDDFQMKFLKSIQFSYMLARMIVKTREDVAKTCNGKAVTEPFELPNKRKLQIFVDYREIRGVQYPEFRAALIKEVVKRFNIGDWVQFESIKTPIEVVDVINTEKEQFVKLKGARKMCSSTMLTLSSAPDKVDENCNDYKIIKRYLT